MNFENTNVAIDNISRLAGRMDADRNLKGMCLFSNRVLQ